MKRSFTVATDPGQSADDNEAEEEGEEEVGGLFRVVRAEQRDRSGRDEVDRTVPDRSGPPVSLWDTEEVRRRLLDPRRDVKALGGTQKRHWCRRPDSAWCLMVYCHSVKDEMSGRSAALHRNE